MSQSNPNFPRKQLSNSLTNSLMAQNQVIDSLTSHISLYHSHSLAQNPNPNPNNNPRSLILKWFSSLTVHQRQAHLTTVDFKFTQLLIQMLGKLRTRGHGFFIILPDLPSRDPPFLPGLCYKQSRCLLSRVAESNVSERRVFESVRFFGSREGEKIDECSCSVSSLDSMTVTEEFVENVELFVETMDKVSNGAFLRGEQSELGSDWIELEWLKSKGYYSIEAFLVNRLEVALRLAWLNFNNGKRRGVKLKEKVNAAGVAANVYWRKKGCMDWWVNLGDATRRKVLTAIIGKAAKSLTLEVLNAAGSASEDEMWLFSGGAEQPMRYNYSEPLLGTIPKRLEDAEFGIIITAGSRFGKPNSLTNVFSSLFVLQDIVTLVLSYHNKCDMGKVFFSALGSISTFTDSILRKLRGILMVISLDCTKLELLGEGNFNSSSDKSKDKFSACSRKKKGRSRNIKKQIPVAKAEVNDLLPEKPLKDLESVSTNNKKADLKESSKMPVITHGKDVNRKTPSQMEMEHTQSLIGGKGRAAARKSRKEKNKNKHTCVNGTTELKTSKKAVIEASTSSFIFQDEATNSSGVLDNLNIQGVPTDTMSQSNVLESNSSPNRPHNQPFREEIAMNVQDPEVGSTGQEDYSKDVTENEFIATGQEDSNCRVECNRLPPIIPVPESDSVFTGEGINLQNSHSASKIQENSTSPDASGNTLDVKEEVSVIQVQDKKLYDTAPTSSPQCLSYEWPSVAPFYFPSINSHVPAATDRLHLDVGHNWHNHIRQPFVPTMHQARNPQIESGCNRILSRPMPMSLDWPPMVRSASGLTPPITCNYGSGFISRRQTAFQQGFASQNFQFNTKNLDDERKYSGDFFDLPDLANTVELADECDSHWISEEEFEVHAVSGIDYNQYFGGGVMYWNPSDHPGTGFSRPPSLSSDDSSWAWHEADMSRAVDDMVAFSSSYSTNGLTSPTAAPFCSPFEPLGPGHQAVSYVVPGNDVPGKVLHSPSPTPDAATEEEASGSLANLSSDVEGKTGDSLPYPILRPIIIPNISRERSRSDFKRGHDHKSPCVPPTRREQPRIKRPPSPVVLCVPRAPRPPPPSPVNDSRKQRGFPTVRSGSSSPRHWGMRGLYHDGTNSEEACVRMDGTEVVWPSWRSKSLSAHPMIHPLPGALLQDHLIAMSQLARDQEHPDVSFPLQPPELQSCPARKASLSSIHSLLNDEIESFCKQVAAENMARKPYINWAVKRVTRSLQVLWPRSRTNVFGSSATGLSLPTSDVDLVVCLPPVRNLEPIKEAGILEGRNGIKETCLQHAARYLANQEWVKNDSLKTVENTAIPIIMLVVEVPDDLITSAASNLQSPTDEQIEKSAERGNHAHSDTVGLEDSASPKCSKISYGNMKDVKSVRLDISFKSPSHTGLQTTELVRELTEQFPAAMPLALVLKQFLADRSLDQSYSGGLSSYCLVLLITRFLQHEHHLGRPINQNFGSLLMDFLYFFGNVFDPRQMQISVQGSGVYINRERGYSIDPIHIDDPLFPTNNVGRNCFRIHQCIKAFSEAYSTLENELTCLSRALVVWEILSVRKLKSSHNGSFGT
ncbi:Nucleotidyltransferase family protein isoform 1 [Theobroma cacao]|uniref:Nucleotidyltransferase family protein isoform 1 n=1 Tax=Theobroma cacao TaxID=3641 RepID=A0A061DU51_THECC|nr:Nucleotidyltransferase family protein isoform 1 [Theobroma cacao]